MSDRVAVTSGGTIVQIGTPVDLYNRPANRFVADFIGESNFVSERSRWSMLPPSPVGW